MEAHFAFLSRWCRQSPSSKIKSQPPPGSAWSIRKSPAPVTISDQSTQPRQLRPELRILLDVLGKRIITFPRIQQICTDNPLSSRSTPAPRRPGSGNNKEESLLSWSLRGGNTRTSKCLVLRGDEGQSPDRGKHSPVSVAGQADCAHGAAEQDAAWTSCLCREDGAERGAEADPDGIVSPPSSNLAWNGSDGVYNSPFSLHFPHTHLIGFSLTCKWKMLANTPILDTPISQGSTCRQPRSTEKGLVCHAALSLHYRPPTLHTCEEGRQRKTSEGMTPHKEAKGKDTCWPAESRHAHHPGNHSVSQPSHSPSKKMEGEDACGGSEHRDAGV